VPSLFSSCGEGLDSHSHLVQFYSDDASLTGGVSRYLAEGLFRGEWIVVIATRDHTAGFHRELERNGLNVAGAIDADRLVFSDARETLARFMVDGEPNPERFDETVGELIRQLSGKASRHGLRAYGEMVDVVWNSGDSASAVRLEQYWNELLAKHGFDLMCAYQIDVFSNEFQAGVLDNVLRAHTHVVPAGSNEELGVAVSTAMTEVLGPRAEGLKLLIKANLRPSWARIPHAEASVLWLRNNLPDYADEILSRARRHYQTALNTGSGYQDAS
jgi:hypothetical protein